MALESAVGILQRALDAGYAVGYFESWSLDSLQGVVDAAEQTRSPVIIGFNGEFLSRPERLAAERLSWYAALGKAAAESATVPCGLIFNECSCDDWTKLAIGAGFNLVMPSAEGRSAAESRRRVASITALAHRRGVAVEAELGELPCGLAAGCAAAGGPTDPASAAAFVAETGVDLLAVSVGNVHVLLAGRRGLDLGRVARIRERVSVPLVLHGGSGIRADSLREAIALGVAKVNYGTVLKQRYLSALREALATQEADPHKLIGMGGTADVLMAGRRAVCDVVARRMALLGCVGRG